MKSKHLVSVTMTFTTAILNFAQVTAQTAPSWGATATHAYASQGAVPTGASADDESVPIVVSLLLRNRAQLERVAQLVASGTIPPISHDEFMSTYAPTQAQAQAVVSYLLSRGYSNVVVDENRLLVSADGTAGIAADAFNTL